MKVVVLGGYGSIGHAVAKACLDRGDTVEIWDRRHATQTLKGVDLFIHCAGMKFVDQCETDPEACVRDNLLTTWLAVGMAKVAGVPHFVFLSTDKACQPVTLMGMAKRLSEAMVVKAGYAAVRLVNVVETRGNVFELWEKQEAAGQPLTVTDRRMRRYFMTIQDAVTSILKVSGMSPGLYSYQPESDISIWALAEDRKNPAGVIETVPRPGDKLTENLSGGENWEHQGGCLYREVS